MKKMKLINNTHLPLKKIIFKEKKVRYIFYNS